MAAEAFWITHRATLRNGSKSEERERGGFAKSARSVYNQRPLTDQSSTYLPTYLSVSITTEASLIRRDIQGILDGKLAQCFICMVCSARARETINDTICGLVFYLGSPALSLPVLFLPLSLFEKQRARRCSHMLRMRLDPSKRTNIFLKAGRCSCRVN